MMNLLPISGPTSKAAEGEQHGNDGVDGDGGTYLLVQQAKIITIIKCKCRCRQRGVTVKFPVVVDDDDDDVADDEVGVDAVAGDNNNDDDDDDDDVVCR